VNQEIQTAFDQSIRSANVKKVVESLGLDHDVKNADETEKFINQGQTVVKELLAKGVDLK
jgi:tripartite-type tricarboxylate transporter receptor subunit TctC